MANIYVNNDNIEDYYSYDEEDEDYGEILIPGTSNADVISVSLSAESQDYADETEFAGGAYIDAKGGNDKIYYNRWQRQRSN